MSPETRVSATTKRSAHSPPRRRGPWIAAALGALLAAAIASLIQLSRPSPITRPARVTRAEQPAHFLFNEIQPVKLANCHLERFGEKNDGGYLLCANLLGAVKSAYSYGISGYDGWGCDVSRKLGVTVHQYDCFDLTQPICDGGDTVFHGECIGTTPGLQDGRTFDTLAAQVAKNGDTGKTLVVKIDVEGAEWDSLLTAPTALLQRIDQMAVEFHGFDQARFIETVVRLKNFFHVAHLHWNNYSCDGGKPPFPAWAYEVLFVNKLVGEVDPSAKAVLPHPLDTPNAPDRPDCQTIVRASGQ